jgi:photosystem II stability/assembly factor-like uncharacterized protein
MKKSLHLILIILFIFTGFQFGFTQQEKINPDSLFSSSNFSGLSFRNLGPAFMSGRIADIAIHPTDYSSWYIAVGSGGVWKTENAGTTWTPVFDKEKSYSIGCITIDPHNPHVIWVGSGENIGGRHVGYGDGIYRSEDGGKSWKNMGLTNSQHISKIIIHPKDPNIIWVAAQGPLWSKGDERGLYKSVDGGITWKKTLGDEQWTGVTDIVIDPRNPNWLYAATWQKHRNVAAYLGGGPGTGIYRSTDGGENWTKLQSGLPTSNMGKIGLAISPQKPDEIYAAIELDRRTGGVYKSFDRGQSWVKQSDVVSSATGPHYYQELYACPHKYDRIYLADVRIQVSNDGGKKFKRLKEEHKHSDNHAIAFRADDPDYLLVGTDGGLYESFDLAENWRYMANLPLTQFYKLAVDDAEPFYNIYGGTQDNSTQGGPSRTDNRHGVRTADWFMTLYADGHQPATEPGNPNIIYSESQEGNLVRVDRTTGEIVNIQPQAEPGEDVERFNWDSPILVSPHKTTRLYFASQRVWKSENRGDSWIAISEDLTKNQDRITLPIMDKTQSWDNAWDINAMSNYNTITSLAESPIQEGLIYAGTDDGIIQLTENGGESWRKINVGSIPGIPETAFINDIKADLFDASTVYVILDNHKFGDLNPYIVKSIDKGNSWISIKGNLPEKTLLWRIVQDHVNEDLFFLASEFGIYFSINAGERWTKLNGNVPTIAFRDLAIQKRENDLVAASFGRGFFVLDDYSPLRTISEKQLQEETTLFQPKNAWWYIQRPVISFGERGSQGAATFQAPNPPFGAIFTYYLSKDLETKKQLRQKEEKKLAKDNKDIPFPGWEELENERREELPEILLIVKDQSGNLIQTVKGPVTKGFNRVAWDLTYPSKDAIDPDYLISKYQPKGMLAAPGTYSVSLAKKVDGELISLSETFEFEVKKLHEGALAGETPENVAAFWREIEEMQKITSATSLALKNAINRIDAMKIALEKIHTDPTAIGKSLYTLKQDLLILDEKLNGHRSKDQIGEKFPPSIKQRVNYAFSGTANSTYGPTLTHIRSMEIAKEEYQEIRAELENIRQSRMPDLEKQLTDAGAPWIEGQTLPDMR